MMSLADQSQQWCPTSVQVTVLQARGLRVKGKNGTNDAYAVMQVAKEKYATSVAEKSVAPMWKEEASFDLPPSHHGTLDRCTLHVHVLHRALVGPDKQLGQAVINLLQLSEERDRNKTQWFKLVDKAGKTDKERGEVLLDIQFLRNDMTASMFDLSGSDKQRSRLGKLKDKVRGKKKAGLSDATSDVVPSFTQVLTDSEQEDGEEGHGQGGVDQGADKEEKQKKRKLKSLFSPKSNLQKSMSQSMSVLPPLPEKNSLLSSSRSSGLNLDSSEGKKKFRFLTHKRSGSSESKSSQGSVRSKHSSPPLLENSNLCINGSHVYSEEPQPRTSRAGSTFSLASSGHGSMGSVEDLHSRKTSVTSADYPRPLRRHSPLAGKEEWSKEEEEEEEEKEDGDKFEGRKRDEEEREREEEKERMREIEEEERRRQLEEKEAAQFKEEEERIRREEEDRIRMEEQERARAEEERIAEGDRKRRMQEEDEMERLAEEKRRLEEERRRQLEEEEAAQFKEEEERIRREEEDRIRMEEQERARAEEERIAEGERKRRMQEEEEMERLAEEKRRLEEERRKEEELQIRREEEERVERMREEETEKLRREMEEKIMKEEREHERREEEEQERRREEEEIQRRKEDERTHGERVEEEKRLRKEVEEKRRREEEQIIKGEEVERRLREEEEEERLKEKERRLREEEEEEERRLREEEMRLREERRLREEEEERRLREDEERRLREEDEERKLREEDEERRLREEEMRRKEEERLNKVEEDNRRMEKEMRRIEEEKLKKEEEEEEEGRRREVEEQEKMVEERRLREEDEERKLREEDEERRLREEEMRRKQDERLNKVEEDNRRMEKEMRRIEEERLKKEEEEEGRRREVEEQEKRVEDEERRKREEERQKRVDDEERREREEEEGRKREEEEGRKREKEEQQKRFEEEERRKRQEEEESRLAEKGRLRREEDQRQQLEDKRRAEEEDKRRAEEEDKRRAEEEQRARVEEERRKEEKRERDEDRSMSVSVAMLASVPFTDLPASSEPPNHDLISSNSQSDDDIISSSNQSEDEIVSSTNPFEEDVPSSPTGARSRSARVSAIKPRTASLPPSSSSIGSIPPQPVVPSNPFLDDPSDTDPLEKKRRAPLPPSAKRDPPGRIVSAAPTKPSRLDIMSVARNATPPGRSREELSVGPAGTAPAGAQRDRRPAPQPPGVSADRQTQREQSVSTGGQTHRLVQMIAPLSRASPLKEGQVTSGQSSTQCSSQPEPTSSATASRHNKGPAPSKPTVKQPPVVFGSNPFEEDETEIQCTEQGDIASDPKNLGPVAHGRQSSADAAAAGSKPPEDKDNATKGKSSKAAHAPLPPAQKTAPVGNQSSTNKRAISASPVDSSPAPTSSSSSSSHPAPLRTSETAENLPAQLQATISASDHVTPPPSEAQPVTAQGIGEEAGGKGAGPTSASRRSHPVKPLTLMEQQQQQQPDSLTAPENKPAVVLCGVQHNGKERAVVREGPYSQLTQAELVSLLVRQQKQLSERDRKIGELEQYIDNLLVRVIEEQPSILMSLGPMKRGL